ncbi:hypothetical protein [Actinomadura violacea]|uniref:Uncharacterized protein n=1 Tax=Actinomadura violacea TaxID=2819934 RepID=A0ABS3RYI1_9ACTN|nr:hypothetical protein [Actinomadura violacea]MBO2461706.1 hypothetical protein [Actinomadura violacea]
MGTLADLEEARARRADRARLAAVHAARHPALRWQAAGDTTGDALAHRRSPAEGGTACGRPGPLELAARDAALCPACYPRTGT